MKPQAQKLMNKIDISTQTNTKFMAALTNQKPKCLFIERISPHFTEYDNIMGVLFQTFKEAIEETNEDKRYFLEKLKMMNDIGEALADYLKELNDMAIELIGEGDEGNGKGDDLPPSDTVVTVVSTVEQASSRLTTAINTVGRLNLKLKPKLRKNLKDLKNQLGLILTDIRKLKKESEKKAKPKPVTKGKPKILTKGKPKKLTKRKSRKKRIIR